MDGQNPTLPEALHFLKDIYQNHMPFDKLLGIKIETLGENDVCVRIDMREELIGNFVKGILHGGVISSVLDLTGGLIASVAVLQRMKGASAEEMGKRLASIGTIDLRVDYLRAGQGKFFRATGNILRAGKRVAVIRTELHNDQNLLIAAGTGTYLTG
ncbi:MAG: thioesterase family protein [Desulfobacterales bacterium]